MKYTIIIFIIAIGLGIYTNYYYGDFELNELTFNTQKDLFSNTQEIHFDHMPITYSLEKSCVGEIVPRVNWAFEIIENETDGLVYFQEVDRNGDINFICYTEQVVEDKSFTQGLTTTETQGNIITGAMIEFWSVSEDTRPTSCQYFPSLELHEILHAFSFGHIENNPYNIMYPFTQECLREIDKKDLTTINGKSFYPADDFDKEQKDCMKTIYSNGQFYGSCVGLISNSEVYCENGYFLTIDKTSCCPEPNMRVEGNYCV